MPTKPELEATIERLKQQIAEQERVLQKIAAKEMVTITLPSSAHNVNLGAAPYVKHKGFAGPDAWSDLVMTRLLKILNDHAIKIESATSPLRLDMGNGIYGRGNNATVPKIVGVMITDMLNGFSEFGRECHIKGFKEGSSMLVQLAQGKMTAADYEDQAARETAMQTQNDYKKYRIEDLRKL